MAGAAAFVLPRYYADDDNPLLRRWCDPQFMMTSNAPWPLVLYGPSGVGKSALVETLAARLDVPCLRITGSDFRRQFLEAAKTRSVSQFRRRFTQAESLLVDGLTWPTDQVALNREFVQILDEHLQQGRPLLVTCLNAPWNAREFSPQLRSRLSSGLVIGVQRPGPAARNAMVAGILHQLELQIHERDRDWLVKALPRTAPLIRQRLSRLALAASSDDNPHIPDRAELRQQLFAQEEDQASAASQDLPQLIRRTARYFGQKTADLAGKTRRKEVVRARAVSMYLAHRQLGIPVRDIGKVFGNRDPSTVRYACQQIASRLEQDAELANAVTQLATRVESDREARLCCDG